eukprot:gene9559-3765_t
MYGFAKSDVGRVFVGKRAVHKPHQKDLMDGAVIEFRDYEEAEKGKKAIDVKLLWKPPALEEVNIEPGARNQYNGFIRDADDREVFFHFSQWHGEGDPSPGAMVSYGLTKGGRLQAMNVEEDIKVRTGTKSSPEPKLRSEGSDGTSAGTSLGGCTDAEAARAGFLFMLEGIGKSVMKQGKI